MEEALIIDLKESILEDNDQDAKLLRNELKEKKTLLMNVMSSPGSGKTSTLLALDNYFKGEITWGVMEADIDSDTDAKTLLSAGVPSIQLHTGGMCHLDADMTRQGIRAFNRDDLDLLVLENVGNLVCPAEYDTGAALNLTILSVPEGDDKPLKYPLMYQECSVLVINKIDALSVFDFSIEKATEGARKQKPSIQVFPISAKTGEGVEALAAYIKEEVKRWQA